MTLRDFIEKTEIYSYWSFELDQIYAYRIIDNDGYEEYTCEEMLSFYRTLPEKTLRKKVAFVTYDPRNLTMNVFLED